MASGVTGTEKTYTKNTIFERNNLNRSQFFQNNQTALVILGSEGFLGKNLLFSLLRDYSFTNQIFLSQKCANGKIKIKEYSTLSEWLIENLLEKFENIIIVNLISGKMQSELDSRHTHFTSPKSIFDEVSKNPNKKIHWVQIESYSQYSTDTPHDEYYVAGKNLFHDYLRESMLKNTTVEFLVLGHLSGPGDPETRFLPLTFRKILKNEKLVLKNSYEQIPLVDVRDVADHLANRLGEIDPLADGYSISSFPVHDMPTILQVFQSAKEISGSSSDFYEIHQFNRRFIERYIPDEQPKSLNANINLRTSIKTLTDTLLHMKLKDLQ